MLVGLYRDNVFEAKLGLALAAALGSQGVRQVVSIPNDRAHRLRRYAKAFGVREVIAHDGIALSALEHEECDGIARQLLAGPLDFESIKRWTFRGFAIGNHVLSTLIRVTFDGSPDLALEENETLLASILAEVVENVVRSEHLMAKIRPGTLLVQEANYSRSGPLVDVALEHGVDVIQTVTTWRDGALMSKRLTQATRRVDAHSVAPETLTLLSKEPWDQRHEQELADDFAARYGGRYAVGRQNQPKTERRSRRDIQNELGLDPERRTCVIFSHVLWDASLFFGVDLFDNYGEWLVASVAAAVDNPRVNWIVKAHPANVFLETHGFAAPQSSEMTLLNKNFGHLPEHIKVLPPDTKISTLSIYEFADVGVTVRGTPGMEIACFGKPAVTCGTGAYSGLGFTYDSASQCEYLERLAAIDEFGPISDEMRVRAQRYVHALFVVRPWRSDSLRIVRNIESRGWSPLDQNLDVVASSLDEFERDHALNYWADWALSATSADFLGQRSTHA